MRYTHSGKPLTKLQVDVNRNWTTADGEKKQETEWFNVVAWGKLAEICNQYLSKGELVYIDGRLHTRYWQDEGGANHSAVEVIAQEMIMLGGRGSDAESQEGQEIPEEDYPF
jgi:single-strand DNA-binding protein